MSDPRPNNDQFLQQPHLEDEIDLKELFISMDKDHSGFISLDELTHTVRRLMADLSEEEIEKIMNAADKNGNGKLQYDELCEFLEHRESNTDPHNHHYIHQHH